METTTRLLDAAEKRMRKGGYNAVSFRDLAEDTGIKSSSVHYHFPKKEDLGSALVERYSGRFFSFLEEISQKAPGPQDKFKAYTKVYRTALTEDDAVCLCGLLGAEIAGLPDMLSDRVRDFFKANIEWLEKALPANMGKARRNKIAGAILASHQGAMMLASSMNDVKIFDSITSTSVKQALAEV
ncbi:MAG: TetR/AcrR family transcriptional regulator [Pseudomonadota bacterium]